MNLNNPTPIGQWLRATNEIVPDQNKRETLPAQELEETMQDILVLLLMAGLSEAAMMQGGWRAAPQPQMPMRPANNMNHNMNLGVNMNRGMNMNNGMNMNRVHPATRRGGFQKRQPRIMQRRPRPFVNKATFQRPQRRARPRPRARAFNRPHPNPQIQAPSMNNQRPVQRFQRPRVQPRRVNIQKRNNLPSLKPPVPRVPARQPPVMTPQVPNFASGIEELPPPVAVQQQPPRPQLHQQRSRPPVRRTRPPAPRQLMPEIEEPPLSISDALSAVAARQQPRPPRTMPKPRAPQRRPQNSEASALTRQRLNAIYSRI